MPVTECKLSEPLELASASIQLCSHYAHMNSRQWWLLPIGLKISLSKQKLFITSWPETTFFQVYHGQPAIELMRSMASFACQSNTAMEQQVGTGYLQLRLEHPKPKFNSV